MSVGGYDKIAACMNPSAQHAAAELMQAVEMCGLAQDAQLQGVDLSGLGGGVAVESADLGIAAGGGVERGPAELGA